MKRAIVPKVDHRKFKEEIYGALARIGGALANPKRLLLLDLLAQRERSVEDLAEEMDISVASASQHLRALAEARLVIAERKATFVFYSLADESVYRMVCALREVAERRLAEVPEIIRRHLGELRGNVRTVTLAELLDRSDHETSLLLDVRPVEEYRSAHVVGARSVPIDQLPREIRTRKFPRDRKIVVYCRGPYCVWADEAVALLRQRGYNARRLQLGVRDCEALGIGVEKAAAR